MNRKLIAIVISVIALTFTLASLSAGNTAASAPNQKAFVGTWERFSTKDAEGKAGEERLVRSFIIFSADGHYSQTTLPAGRAKSDKPLKEMTKEELLNRLEGTTAVYGTYTIAGNKLTRKEITDLNPNLEGTELVQMFRFEGDMLILTSATGNKFEARFRRVK